MRSAWRLLGNDLRLLVRSRGLLAMLVVYPLIVAALVAVALQSGERQPSIAFVNNDTSNRTVRVGERRLGVRDYEERLAREVDLTRLDSAAAATALRTGRVSAIVTVPEGFIGDLQSGLRSPEIGLEVSTRSPLEAQSISRRLEAAVSRLNQELAQTYVKQTLDLVQIIIDGGDISVFTREGNVLGLKRSEKLVRDVQRRLTTAGDRRTAAELEPLVNFIVQAGFNLDLANAAATSISRPIRLNVPPVPSGREPLSGFGFAGALLVSLALVGVLLAAAALSSEREGNTLVRLRRGLVSDGALVGEKVVFGALVCVAMGAILLVVVRLTTSLSVGRWGLWLPTLFLAGVAFAAFGVLLGAIARETRSALLAALMLALPLIFLALFTQSDAASSISQVAPFGPAFRSFQSLLIDADLDTGRLWLRLGQLGLLSVVFGGVATVMLRRRAEA